MNSRIFIALLWILPFTADCQKIVSGKIFDKNLKALAGAQIETIDKSIFTRTDHMGYFRLEIPYGYDKVGIWYIGMSYEKVYIKNSTALNYILFPEMDYSSWTGEEIDRFLGTRNRQRMKILKQAGLHAPGE